MDEAVYHEVCNIATNMVHVHVSSFEDYSAVCDIFKIHVVLPSERFISRLLVQSTAVLTFDGG